MTWSVHFAPLLPVWLIAALGTFGLGFAIAGVFLRARGALLRLLAFAALLFALAHPVLLEEERAPERDVALVVLDQSVSETIGDRLKQGEKTFAALTRALDQDKTLETRVLRLGQAPDGTMLFGPASERLADVSRDRLAGVVLITDGEVHDVPEDARAAGFDAPVHTLITGKKGERDRKLTVLRAPVFGIVGEPIELQLRVDDFGTEAPSGLARLTIYVDGRERASRYVEVGKSEAVPLVLEHGGQNVIEAEVEPGADELTLANNHVAIATHGVRDRLRVLLVTGEPHAGERTWRNLLKADPAVDLVHFTILRPPEKQDGTPIDELSLIAFPTRELFAEKLDQFDLIIFDRYRRRGVLPLVYLANVAEYVENGGALLDAAGPSFATSLSLYRTPLAAILPAQPTGDVLEQGFRVKLTAQGLRHPVTAGLSGAAADANAEPSWGRWFRLIGTEAISGTTLLAGPAEKPALVLDRVGQGRVAQLLSDETWLWARGFEGGGPQAELLRRLAHWLMKEPELEEESLAAEARSGTLTITRRTMADSPPPVQVTTPTGAVRTVFLTPAEPGLFRGSTPAAEQGLYRLDDGLLSAVAAAGPLNPQEFADVRATEAKLAPVAKATGGGIIWLEDLTRDAPALRRVPPGREAAGKDWIGLRENGRYTVKSVSQRALLEPLGALALIASLLVLAWRRESR
jgi:hypothetical protein